RLHFFYRRLAGGPDDIHDLTLEVSKGGAERVVRLAPPPVPQTFQHRFMNLTRSSLSGQITPRGFAPRTPLHARSRGPMIPTPLAWAHSRARSPRELVSKPIAGGRARLCPLCDAARAPARSRRSTRRRKRGAPPPQRAENARR